jgi:hypothetical protein
MFVRLMIINSLSRDDNGTEFFETDNFKELNPQKDLNFSYEPDCLEHNAILPTKEYMCRSSVVFTEGGEFDMCYNPNNHYAHDFDDPTHFKILEINKDKVVLQIFNAKEGTTIQNDAEDFEHFKSKKLTTNIVELKKNYALSFSQSSSNHLDHLYQLVSVEDIFE